MGSFLLSAKGWRLALPGVLVPFLVWATEPNRVVADHPTTSSHVLLATDTDGDGVDDEQDLCPNTPTGTTVNAYGCPLSLTTCDYTTDSFTLTSTGGSGTGTVGYVLTDSVGTIVQVNNTPSFSGLSGSHTYMALAVSHDGSIVNLTSGQALSAVSASCVDWSDALVLKVCVAVTTPPCDYTVGATISLNATGGSSTGGTLTSYVLVNSAGTIVKISTTPSFPTAGLTGGTYSAYALVYTDDASITNLQTGSLFAALQASCIAISDPLSIVLCADCGTAKCVPIQVSISRRR